MSFNFNKRILSIVLSIVLILSAGTALSLRSTSQKSITSATTTSFVFDKKNDFVPDTEAYTTTTLPPTTTTLIPSKYIDSYCVEFYPLAIKAGFTSEQWPIVSWILFKESRCHPNSWNREDPGSGSRGLMQINSSWCGKNTSFPQGFLTEKGVLSAGKNSLDTCSELFDPFLNLKAGLAIYDYEIDNCLNMMSVNRLPSDTNCIIWAWHPWSIYTKKYNQLMN